MIRYSLRCDKGHDFDGWFRSSDAFETQAAAGQVACTICGSAQVQKTLMAPSVPARDNTKPAKASALEKLRAHVEANSDYVGPRFAETARAIHEGHEPERAIHGEARLDEAKKLIEDGVPIAPLPFIPRQKTN
ncbi:MAG: DUF1178 family protein [Paracoccus sp. (in: a-proteobacteria)]|nr:DUF1178 family protein [Paracoccus sp. (in: a-proteobacteria)]